MKSLYWKLTLAFVLVAAIAAALVAVFIRVTGPARLTQLVMDQQTSQIQQMLTEYYTSTGSWSGIAVNWRELQWQNSPAPNGPGNGQFGNGNQNGLSLHDRWKFFGLADANGVLVVPVPVQGNAVTGTTVGPADLKAGVPITVNGKQVGTLLVANQPPDLNPEENLFLSRTNQALLLGSLGALVLAVILGIFLASTLTRPLQALTKAAQNITKGQLEQEVQVKSKDEIGQLASAFNQMSAEVARVNQLRRRMTADIAHDLRTPLTVISGYVESMRDGVLQPTPERLNLMYTEIERLQNLVGDLRMLTQADAGELPLNLQTINPRGLLEHSAALFEHHASQQNVFLAVEAPDDLPAIHVDEARMMQILDNLLSNALRYTPSGGQITLAGAAAEGAVILSVRDTGSGIAAEELPYIFDRFYRADPSRHAENGESGLGLAIVKALVESQQGLVWAESTPGKGASLYIKFPAAG
jgi:signal transduction histidine kinase